MRIFITLIQQVSLALSAIVNWRLVYERLYAPVRRVQIEKVLHEKLLPRIGLDEVLIM